MSQKGIKTLSIASFASLSVALIIALQTPPASRYEISIYDSLPAIFWILLTVSISSAVAVLMYSALLKKRTSKLWIAGFLGIVLAYSVFLLLPMFRGYYLGVGDGWDTLAHIGEVRNVLSTGHTGSMNFYPILHVLGSVLTVSTLVLPETVATSVLPVIFLPFYLSSVYLLGSTIAKDRKKSLIVLVFATPLLFSFFHRSIHPAFFSLYAVPLLLYLWHKRKGLTTNRVSTTILLLLVGFFITFCHPVTALVVLVIFSSFLILERYSAVLFESGDWSNRHFRRREESTINFVLILLTTFLVWYFSYSSFQGSFKRVTDWLIYQAYTPLAQEQLQLLTVADLSLSQQATYFFNIYGAIFICLLLSLISLSIVLRDRLVHKKSNPSELLYAFLLVVMLCVSALFFFGYLIEYNAIRILRFAILISVILNGLVFGRIIMNLHREGQSQKRLSYRVLHRGVLPAVIMFLLVISISISVFNSYGSPRTLRGNEEITHMEASGVRWFLDHSNHEMMTISNVNIPRFEDLFGYAAAAEYNRVRFDSEMIPSHFGYDGNLSVIETFDFEDTYLITTRFDEISSMVFPPNVRPKTHQYLEEDFLRLREDRAVLSIYSNGELNLWRVYDE